MSSNPKTLRVAIGGDEAAFQLKEVLIDHLRSARGR